MSCTIFLLSICAVALTISVMCWLSGVLPKCAFACVGVLMSVMCFASFASSLVFKNAQHLWYSMTHDSCVAFDYEHGNTPAAIGECQKAGYRIVSVNDYLCHAAYTTVVMVRDKPAPGGSYADLVRANDDCSGAVSR